MYGTIVLSLHLHITSTSTDGQKPTSISMGFVNHNEQFKHVNNLEMEYNVYTIITTISISELAKLF